mgnify:CR=1 FL=1
MGIKIVPPDVSFRNNKFELYDYESIIVGLSYIKGINNIEIDYEPEYSLDDFFSINGYNKRIKEALIKSGACDCFGMSRGEMLSIALDYHIELKNVKPFAMLVGMNSLFDSKKRFSMFRDNGIQILVPDGRTKFISNEDKKLVAPPFQAVYVCHNFLPETICYEGENPIRGGNELWGDV